MKVFGSISGATQKYSVLSLQDKQTRLLPFHLFLFVLRRVLLVREVLLVRLVQLACPVDLVLRVHRVLLVRREHL